MEEMSVVELKERHPAATQNVNNLRERLKQKRELLLNTDVAGYTRSQGKTLVTFGPTDLVCCRTLQVHRGKVDFCKLVIFCSLVPLFFLVYLCVHECYTEPIHD